MLHDLTSHGIEMCSRQCSQAQNHSAIIWAPQVLGSPALPGSATSSLPHQ